MWFCCSQELRLGQILSSTIPITIVTGKTTLLLNLIPQLPTTYRLALKNEFGDVAMHSELASTQSISGVRELNGVVATRPN